MQPTKQTTNETTNKTAILANKQHLINQPTKLTNKYQK